MRPQYGVGQKASEKVGPTRACPADDVVGDIGLRAGKAAPAREIGRLDAIRDVVKQQRQAVAPHVEHLRAPVTQVLAIRGVTVADVKTGPDTVDETQTVRLTGRDEPGHDDGPGLAIGLSPQRTVMQVVLRAIEVRVESPRRHLFEQRGALGCAPGGAVEALDHSREKHRWHSIAAAGMRTVTVAHGPGPRQRRRPFVTARSHQALMGLDRHRRRA